MNYIAGCILDSKISREVLRILPDIPDICEGSEMIGRIHLLQISRAGHHDLMDGHAEKMKIIDIPVKKSI
jgi:hypothetical protein